jgi:mRNA-degrading endonuclease RelE of RelBE toxin-antitoxin system
MTHILEVKTIPVSVIELPQFARAVAKIWSERELAAFTDFIARHPEAGVIVPGTGGHRKIRWATQGQGKRGGARVVYFFMVHDKPIYLTAIYTKGDKDNISQAERNELRAIAAEMKKLK